MWHFRKKAANEKIRNPIQGEFFATDAIDGPAQALVRESNQNSLDAAIGTEPVRVVLTLATGSSALPADRVAQLFDGAWPHYSASGNGLQDPPTPGTPCSYLLVEDYGTRGLTGDPSQSDPDEDPAVKNPFFLFFRAEGLSAKTGMELGRWGVGKFVFPRSSQASTHFGVTVRHDDGRRLLLGAVTLKAHRIAGDSSMYTPDGLFGHASPNGFVQPLEDSETIDAICALFGVKRTTEPGLSVIVPFVDPLITFEALLLAAVRDYFVPILAGRLEITIRAGASEVTIDQHTLDTVVGEHVEVLGAQVQAQVSLARTAAQLDDNVRVTLNMHDPARAAKWSPELLTPDTLTELKSRLAMRESVAVRVPVTVRTKANGASASYFDVLIKPDRNSDGRPVFVREGIIISDVRGRRAREIRSLIMIEDKPLATMLGDSENPAHTQWQKDGSNFKGRYTYGKAVIDFVTDSVGELIAIVNSSSEEADASLTVDYFSVAPSDDEDDGEQSFTKQSKPKKGINTAETRVKVKSKPAKLRVSRISGGFSIAPSDGMPTPPFLVLIKCAYDIRNGNALKKWNPADFILGASGLPVVTEGAVCVRQARDNQLLLQVDGPSFRATVEGFDVNRDVLVRFDIPEVASAGTET